MTICFTDDHIFILQLFMAGYSFAALARTAVEAEDMPMLVAVLDLLEWFEEGGVYVT